MKKIKELKNSSIDCDLCKRSILEDYQIIDSALKKMFYNLQSENLNDKIIQMIRRRN